jgi:hypothetical protein
MSLSPSLTPSLSLTLFLSLSLSDSLSLSLSLSLCLSVCRSPSLYRVKDTGFAKKNADNREKKKEEDIRESEETEAEPEVDAPNEVSMCNHIKSFLKRTGKISDHVVWGLALGFNPQTKH